MNMQRRQKMKSQKWYNSGSSLSKKQKAMRRTKILTLTVPDHLLLEHVFPRLPAKSVIRFKSVCKNWYFSLSSPDFAQSHFQFSSSRHNFLLHNNSLGSFLLPYDEEHGLKEVIKLHAESIPDIDYCNGFVGSCNGILCLDLNRKVDNKFILCNPATHECLPINLPLKRFPKFNGFGYTPLNDDYNIIAIYKRGVKLDIYVYSLNSGKWKSIGGMEDDCGSGIGGVNGLLVDDTLYWCIFEMEPPYEAYVIGFHLESEEMEAIAVMECSRAYLWINLYEIKGRLSLHCFRDDGSSEIWILKERGRDSDSWVKLFSLRSVMHLMGFSVTGKCLMQRGGASQLMFVDLGIEAVKDGQVISFSRNGYQFRTIRYVESLITPWNK